MRRSVVRRDCDVQLARLLASLFGGEAEQQPPGVAIRGDSAGTRVRWAIRRCAQNASSVGRARSWPLSEAISRLATRVSSSGVACRYQ